MYTRVIYLYLLIELLLEFVNLVVEFSVVFSKLDHSFL
jgi:hypothetical protein